MFVIKYLQATAVILLLHLAESPAHGSTIFVEDQKVDGRTVVLILGAVEYGDHLKFAETVDKIQDAVIIFDSGRAQNSKKDVLAAIEIGTIIQSKGFDTAILHSGTCSSTCSLMWLAGKQKWVSENVDIELGNYIQSVSDPHQLSDMYAIVGYYLGKLSMNPEFVITATSWRGVNVFAAIQPNEISQLGVAVKILSSEWVENATYPNGPLPPPPVSIFGPKSLGEK